MPDIIFLFPLFIIGLVSAITDLRQGKVKNQLILAGIIIVILAYLSDFIYNLSLGKSSGHILYMAINGLIGLAFGYFFWQSKMWAAGDAKIFAIYAFLIPLKLYPISPLPYFPAFTLILNTFSILIVYIIAEAILKFFKFCFDVARKNKSIYLKKFIVSVDFQKKIKEAVKTYVAYMGTYVLISIIMLPLNNFVSFKAGSNFFLMLIFLIISRQYLFRFLFKNKVIISIVILLVIFYSGYLSINHHLEVLGRILKNSFIYMALIGASLKIMNYYIGNKEIKIIKISQLKIGAVIFQPELKLILEKDDGKIKKNFGTIYPDGLTSEQAAILKNCFSEKPEAEIKIYKTLPFAFFMFISFLIGTITQKTIIDFILRI